LNKKNNPPEDHREKVLDAALKHVPSIGWNMGSFCAGASDIGLEPVEAYRVFPGGLPDATRFYSDSLDQKMLLSLSMLDLESLRIRDRVIAGVRARIEAGEGNRDVIKRLAAYFLLPGKNRLALELIWRTCDTIWFVAGDRATDFNFYTKRGLLLPVYSSTLLVWLGDESDGYIESWDYLERQISRVLELPKISSKLKKTFCSIVPNGYRSICRVQ
tara:strand:- start:580 stop:1227 length:648 start_codon:yes stop_codon:yes gene_type:complete